MLFDEEDSDSPVEFKTDTEYAKNYNTWRKKEEKHKLEARYGADVLDDDDEASSSSDSDTDDEEVILEKDFLKTLSMLKNKDPRIYDENYKFYNSDDEKEKVSKKPKKQAPVYLKDYERQLLLEKGGQISEDDEDMPKRFIPKTPKDQEEELRQNLKAALNEVDEDVDENDEIGGLFKARQKTTEEKKKEDEDYYQWLRGQTEHLKDEAVENELKPLKDYWNNPNLDENEKILRDFILEGKFTRQENASYIPTYDEIVNDSENDLSEDEKIMEKQELFEHKYNFRFEEPDQEFIKQYPRTIANSVRYTDDKRKVKRNERKERKLMEKQKKMDDLKQLQNIKKLEIEEKIKQLQEVTGSDQIGFNPEDLDDDFDPEKYDQTMQKLFNEDFYQGEEGDQKPEFPDLDKELEIENWDSWKGQDKVDGEEEETENGQIDDDGPHCEDENFNMDCDYDPAAMQKEMIDNSRRKKKRKRKSKFAEAISKTKPVFDPNNKTFAEYLDEYYALNCEDIIDNQPCRFHYRQVKPNSFGLSIEEILMAKEKELNKWCSLKKTVQYRPDHVEEYDLKAYENRGKNMDLKKRILPSLFTEEKLEDVQIPSSNSVKIEKESSDSKIELKENSTDNPIISEKSNKKKSKNKGLDVTEDKSDDVIIKEESEKTFIVKEKSTQSKKKKIKSSKANTFEPTNMSEEVSNSQVKEEEKSTDISISSQKDENKKRKRQQDVDDNKHLSIEASHKSKKRKNNLAKKNNFKKSVDIGISDARLAAYGLNPKKFKNKLKYKKNNN